MGEMADYTLDQIEDLYEQDEECEDYYPTTPSCKYCGMSGLHWIKTEAGWRLHKNYIVHTCAKYAQWKKAHERQGE